MYINEFIEFFNDREDILPSFELFLMNTPATEGEFIFTISIELDNGIVIAADSDLVYLDLEDELVKVLVARQKKISGIMH